MAHNINGTNYVGRLAAWHNIGTVTGKFMTAAEVLSANDGGLNYEVFKDQLFDMSGEAVDAYGLFRSDNHAFLSTCSESYGVVQHKRGFDLCDALVAAKGGAHYETAGALGKGEIVWASINLAETIHVGDDISHIHLLFYTSYDQSHSHTYRPCAERVVCHNTFKMAISEKVAAQFKLRHSRNANARLDQAHKALESLAGEAKSLEQKLNFLASRKVTRESLISVLDTLFPKTKNEDSGETFSSTRRDNMLVEILRTYESNDNNAFPEQRGTVYNLLNAITDYTDHSRNTQGGDKGRAESALFGTGDRLKSQALEVLLETAGTLPTVERRTVYANMPEAPANGSLLDAIAAGMTS